MQKGLDHWADILIVIIYFIAVIAVGLWSLRTPNRGNVKGYFLAGRTMPWFAVGASLYSSNIGSEHFVGLAGAGASTGIALILFEWFATFLIVAAGWLYLPVYISAGVYTLPEYIEKRHGGKRLRIYLSILSLALHTIARLAVSIFAGALYIQMSLGWNMYLSIAVLLFIAGFYTILGGLRAVMYTDTFQTVVMTLGALIVVGIGFHKVGGMAELEVKYKSSIPSVRNPNSTCGLPKQNAFNIFLDAAEGDYPWPGLLIQSSLGCMWYWCCEQVMVQRSLGAKSLSHAKGGALIAGFMKILPLYLFIYPGMISRVLFPDDVACADPEECLRVCDNPVGCSNIAYPKLVLGLLPIALRGLMIAVMVSAIMSSLTSIFNSSSTVFTMDIWRRIRPQATQRELLITGRIFVIFMCGVSILWIPLVKASESGRLFQYMTAVEGCIASPLGIIFLLSVFWKRTTEKGTFWGLLLTHVCGIIRLVLVLVYPTPTCGEPETRPAIVYKLHYLYFSVLLLLFCVAVTTIISLITEPRSEKKLEGVTWWTRYSSADGDSSKEKWDVDKESMPDDKEPMPEDKESAPDDNNENFESNSLHEIKELETNDKLEPDSRTEEEEIGTASHQHGTRCQRITNFLCGLPEADSEESTNVDIINIRRFLTQKPTAKKVLNILAATLLGLVLFLTGYYR